MGFVGLCALIFYNLRGQRLGRMSLREGREGLEARETGTMWRIGLLTSKPEGVSRGSSHSKLEPL